MVDKISFPVRWTFLLGMLLAAFSLTSCAGPSASIGLVARDRRVTLTDGVGIVQIAKRYLGTPYKYGGATPKGFDCSGLIQYVYSKAGYEMPRGTKEQYRALKPVRVPAQGDLIFFKIDGKKVSHVGIYAGNFKFIHSPRTGKRVSYADIRNPYWKKRYAGSRTFFW